MTPYKRAREMSRMKRYEMTASQLREILHYAPETGVFTRIISTGLNTHAGDIAGGLHSTGYFEIRACGHKYKAHVLAWLYVYGVYPDAFLDHINGNRADNRIENLRQATKAENAQNYKTRKDNTSGATGVIWHKRTGKWAAALSINKHLTHLGLFASFDEAKMVRDAAKKEFHKFQPEQRA